MYIKKPAVSICSLICKKLTFLHVVFFKSKYEGLVYGILIETPGIICLFVFFGTGMNFTYIHINANAQALGDEKSFALHAFHSFTGCDTVSVFSGKVKLSAWAAWKFNNKILHVHCRKSFSCTGGKQPLQIT